MMFLVAKAKDRRGFRYEREYDSVLNMLQTVFYEGKENLYRLLCGPGVPKELENKNLCFHVVHDNLPIPTPNTIKSLTDKKKNQ